MSRAVVSALSVTLGLSLVACAPSPPPGWDQGGAPLVVTEAHWARVDKDAVHVTPDGRLLEDGDVVFQIDRVGRVAKEDGEPVAVLLPDGRLAGEDRILLGHVGLVNASPPGSDTAWLSVTDDGTVIRYDEEGERINEGKWQGCEGEKRRTCTLVTHLVFMRDYWRPAPRGGVSVGVGIGIWH